MENKIQRKQSRYKVGMVYAVPLVDGSFGLAQAGEAMMANVIYVALFSDRYKQLPENIPELTHSNLVSLTATWKQALNRGVWLSLAVAKEEISRDRFPDEQYKDEGYTGASLYDAGILSEFLSAYHGLLPWNVMYEADYYDQLLLAGVARPATAIVLDDDSRMLYRQHHGMCK